MVITVQSSLRPRSEIVGRWTASTPRHENYWNTALAPLGERVAIPQSRESRVRGLSQPCPKLSEGLSTTPLDRVALLARPGLSRPPQLDEELAVLGSLGEVAARLTVHCRQPAVCSNQSR